MRSLKLAEPCQICSTKNRNVISEIGRDFKKLVTVICTGCGLIHAHPIPKKKELKEFYEKEYRLSYKSCLKPKLKHVFRYATQAFERVKEIQKYTNKNQNTLLDIGSGSGEFLYMALKFGFDAKGIEPNIGYANYSKKYLDLPVENTTYDEAELKNQSYDIVNLVDVLEHLPEPLSCLLFINRILKENGILAISVPNIGLFSHSPLTQFHYAHIYNFNPQTLEAMLTKAGFKIMNPDKETTTLIVRKVREPNLQLDIIMNDNYQLLQNQFNEQGYAHHYKTLKPYHRFARKCYQYTFEFFSTLFMRSPKKILDYFYNKLSAFLTMLGFAFEFAIVDL